MHNYYVSIIDNYLNVGRYTDLMERHLFTKLVSALYALRASLPCFMETRVLAGQSQCNLAIENNTLWATVAHACNSSYSGGRNQEDHDLMSA
jgi:hypothetical protein